MTNIHILTFAGGSLNFKQAGERFKNNALSSDFFSSIYIESEKSLKRNHKNFWKVHRNFIYSHKLGFGHYLWKPYIISHYLSIIPENDILFYLDVGCVLNFNNIQALNRFHEYISLVSIHGSLAMQLFDGEFGIDDLSENAWNSIKIMDHLNISEDDRKQNQIQAGILLLKNNTRNKEVMQEWYNLCIKNDYEFLDQNVKGTYEGFVSLRFDQSIFSALYKKYQLFHISDETYFPQKWFTEGAGFPIWAMRLRNGSNPLTESKLNYYFKFIEYLMNLKRIFNPIAK